SAAARARMAPFRQVEVADRVLRRSRRRGTAHEGVVHRVSGAEDPALYRPAARSVGVNDPLGLDSDPDQAGTRDQAIPLTVCALAEDPRPAPTLIDLLRRQAVAIADPGPSKAVEVGIGGRVASELDQ